MLLQFLLYLFLVDQGDFVVECLGERVFEMWEVNDSLALVVVSYGKPVFYRNTNSEWKVGGVTGGVCGLVGTMYRCGDPAG